MNVVFRTTWRYAFLFILLFGIAAFAAYATIERLAHYDIADDARQQMSVAIWLLTLGFMAMSGAMGLLVIRFSVESESRRRIGRFVNAMDYLSDGVVMLKSDGAIEASNPSARQLAPKSAASDAANLNEAFPCLDAEDVKMLLDERHTWEIEREVACPEGLRTLRFRSQHSSGVRLVLIGDVTEKKKREIRERQMAQLQLVGRIAAGVAHDFNNILCAISGYASLMQRLPQSPQDLQDSIKVILDETDRGSRLSRQLLELSRSGASGDASSRLEENVSAAVELLRVALSSKWSVKSNLEPRLPAVSLTPAQVEQVVLNLGLLSADEQPRPGNVTISLSKPGKGHLLDVGSWFAAVILVSARADPEAEESSDKISSPVHDARENVGVIQSVVHSIVNEAGGRLDYMTAQDGLCIYRVCLPHLDANGGTEAPPIRRERLQQQLNGWSVMLAAPPDFGDAMARAFRAMGMIVEQTSDIISLLAAIQKGRGDEGVVLHEALLEPEREYLLRALVKLNAGAGLVVLCRDAEAFSADEALDVAFESVSANPETVAFRLAETRIRVADAALTAQN